MAGQQGEPAESQSVVTQGKPRKHRHRHRHPPPIRQPCMEEAPKPSRSSAPAVVCLHVTGPSCIGGLEGDLAEADLRDLKDLTDLRVVEWRAPMGMWWW